MARRKRLGEALIEANIISQEQLEDALRFQEEKSKLLGQILIDMGWVTEEDVYYAMSKVLNVDYVNLDHVVVNREAIRLVPQSLAVDHNILPFFIQDGKILHLAMENPLELDVVQQIEFKTGMPVKLFIAPPEQLRKAVRKYYNIREVPEIQEKGIVPKLKDMAREGPTTKPEKVSDELDEALAIIQDVRAVRKGSQIVKLVNLIITGGIKKRVSDIYFEPSTDLLLVHFKVDEILSKELQIPKWLQLPLFSRIKVMAGMNVSESQTIRNGRSSIMYDKRKFDLRISTVPTPFGEKIEIRILDSQIAFGDISTLGLSPADLDMYRTMLQQPRGWIIVAGPGANGKTTTLYALLNATKNFTHNVITIEDPIEYQLPGITQCQVNPRVGLTFVSGLNSILRQNPQVILIGEIRDSEVAATAMRASETGHLVLTTLQVNDAVSVVDRLYNLGFSPNRVASNLLMVIAQRLVKKICPDCRIKYTPEREELRKIGIPPAPESGFDAYKGVGCKTCNNTGYYGQIGLYELFVLNERLREEIAQQSANRVLKNLAIEAGMKPLLQDGIEKIRQGITTIEEVAKVCVIEPIGMQQPTVHVQESQDTCKQCGKPLAKPWAICPFCGTSRTGSWRITMQPPTPKPGIKIVLADDSKASRKILSFVLGRKGYQVITAVDGEDALEKIRSERPDLIILDIAMPKRDGFAVCHEVRSHTETRAIPVIMLTDSGSLEDKLKGISLGANDYITKPFTLEELLARVEFVLRRTQ
jgi:type IV pilus assembly protein PilB